jgi:hypothetical protein
MRFPRVRFTMRHMVIWAAVIALCCAAIERLVHGFEDTVYADGYSEPSFLSLKNGMTKPQVRAIMGEPKAKNLWIDGGEEELWMYSISPTIGDKYGAGGGVVQPSEEAEGVVAAEKLEAALETMVVEKVLHVVRAGISQQREVTEGERVDRTVGSRFVEGPRPARVGLLTQESEEPVHVVRCARHGSPRWR